MAFASLISIHVVVAVLLLITTPTTIQACSCPLIYEPFEVQFDKAPNVDVVYIFGQSRLGPYGRFAGYVDDEELSTGDDVNEDIYLLAYNWRSYKGCSNEKTYEILVTSGNSALCGVYPEPGWYIIETRTDINHRHGFKRLQLCDLFIPWTEFTFDQFTYAQENKEQYCVSYRQEESHP